MGRTTVLVKAVKSIVSNGLALLGAWGLLEIVKRLIEARAPAPVDWNVPGWVLTGRVTSDIRTVGELISRNLGPTVELLIAALLLAMVLSGLQVALFWRSSRAGNGGVLRVIRFMWLDLWTSISPSYLNLLALFVFAIWLGVLPSGSAQEGANLLTRLRHLTIPVVVLSIVPAMVLTSKGLREIEARSPLPAEGRRYLLPTHLALYLGAEALRMVGLLLALAAFVGGRTISGSLYSFGVGIHDAPTAIGIAWVMAIMVVVSRLLADLVEAADGYMLRRTGTIGDAPPDGRSSRKGNRFTLGLALVVFGALAALALFSPWTAGYSPYDQSLRERLASPSLSHLLGADYVGRDIFSRTIHGLRLEYLISLIGLAGVVLVSAPWSALVVWLRDKRAWLSQLGHEVVMWPVHVLTAFPWIALAALVFAYNFGIPGVEGQPPEPDESTLVFIAALLLVFVPRGVRMCVECFSATPPLLSPLRRAIASMTVLVPMVIAAAVFLSINMGILGLGLVPPRPSLGLIFSEMRDYMGTLALVTLVCVPLVSVLLISSLLLAGEYLLDRMNVRSGRVWSRGIE